MSEQRIIGGSFQIVSELSSGGFGQTPSAKPSPSSSAGAKKPTLAEQADTNPQAVIDALLPRLGTGTLSLGDLNLLMGVCILKNNPSCRDRVVQEIAKVKENPPKPPTKK